MEPTAFKAVLEPLRHCSSTVAPRHEPAEQGSLDFLIMKMGTNVPTLRCLQEVFAVTCHRTPEHAALSDFTGGNR